MAKGFKQASGELNNEKKPYTETSPTEEIKEMPKPSGNLKFGKGFSVPTAEETHIKPVSKPVSETASAHTDEIPPQAEMRRSEAAKPNDERDITNSAPDMSVHKKNKSHRGLIAGIAAAVIIAVAVPTIYFIATRDRGVAISGMPALRHQVAESEGTSNAANSVYESSSASENTVDSSGKSNADDVFCMFADSSYKCDLKKCELPNGYKYKIPSETVASSNTKTIYGGNEGTFFLVYNTDGSEESIGGVVLYCLKNELEQFFADAWGETTEEMAEDAAEYNVDIIDMCITEFFESMISDYGGEDGYAAFNNSDSKINTISYRDSDTITTGKYYNDGAVMTASIFEKENEEDEEVDVCVIKRVNEGEYVKLFLGFGYEVKLTENNREMLAKLEYTAKQFE